MAGWIWFDEGWSKARGGWHRRERKEKKEENEKEMREKKKRKRGEKKKVFDFSKPEYIPFSDFRNKFSF